jgi:hypothetical protein
MNIDSPEKVQSIIDTTETVEYDRSANRDKISRLVQGFPPVDVDTAKKLGLDIIFNGLDALVLNRAANLQYFNAFQSRNRFFNISCDWMPPEKQAVWQAQLSDFINEPMKESREYGVMLDQKFASVVLHGIGAQFWFGRDRWLPEFKALPDLRVATDTETSLRNLQWIALMVPDTVGELVNRVFGKYAHKGWDKKEIAKILNLYKDKNWEPADYDWEVYPEKMTQIIRQNLLYYTSDTVPTIKLWHFYHLDQEHPGGKKVYLKVVASRHVEGYDNEKFLFTSDIPIADNWDQFMQVQFGDLNAEPPYKWHSVRSLGFMLHEPAFWMSLTRCRGLQHLWENFQQLMQFLNGSDKGRTQKVELFKGVLPQDVRIIPQSERHQIDSNLLGFMMAQMKQMMGESSSAYTQQPDTGTSKERTAFEVMTVIQTANQLLSGLLNMAFRNEIYAYKEICRRFCNPKAIDPDIRGFWKNVKKARIPIQFINQKLWKIEPEIPLGSGNQTLELAAATALMSVRGQHGPEAQQIILNMYDTAVSRNASLAQRLAPVGERMGITDAQRDADAMFGTLMSGGSPQPREGLNPIEQIETIFQHASDVVNTIKGSGGAATIPQAAGLTNVAQYLQELIQLLASDDQQKERVTAYSKMLASLFNEIKGFAQQIAEQMGKQNGNGEGAAKVQAMLIQAQSKAEIDKLKAANKERMKQVSFELSEMRKNIETMSQMNRDDALAKNEALIKRMEALQSMASQEATETE